MTRQQKNTLVISTLILTAVALFGLAVGTFIAFFTAPSIMLAFSGIGFVTFLCLVLLITSILWGSR